LGRLLTRSSPSPRSRQFSGRANLKTGEKEMEGLCTHYAIMDAQEECVQREMPLGVVAYHMYLKLIHSGLTLDEFLSLPEEKQAEFVGEGCQITCSAGLFPYEQDFVPGLCLSFFQGIELTAQGTEDMVRLRRSCFSHVPAFDSCVARRAGLCP
jgi:hypothetical protein